MTSSISVCLRAQAGSRDRGNESGARMSQVSDKVAAVDWTTDVNVEQKQVALCPHCRAETQPSAKFCPECGQALIVNLTCERCGAQAPAGTKFCPECGNSSLSRVRTGRCRRSSRVTSLHVYGTYDSCRNAVTYKARVSVSPPGGAPVPVDVDVLDDAISFSSGDGQAQYLSLMTLTTYSTTTIHYG